MLRNTFFAVFFLLFVPFLLLQCSDEGANTKGGGKLLAKVYDKSLYSSELDGLIPEGSTSEDSALITTAFVQRWVRDALLMYEAERNIPKDLNIDKLVRDYRASLVRYNFEEELLKEKLDSTISESEIQTFYENNKDQFELESAILRVNLLKVPVSAPQGELNKLWYSKNASDKAKLAEYAKQWATTSLLNDQKWYKLDDIAAILPSGSLTSDNLSSRREGTINESNFRFYFRVLESVRGKQTAPLDYVKDQAAKVILHRRKTELLEKWKEDLYQKELRRENIKFSDPLKPATTN